MCAMMYRTCVSAKRTGLLHLIPYEYTRFRPGAIVLHRIIYNMYSSSGCENIKNRIVENTYTARRIILRTHLQYRQQLYTCSIYYTN